MGEARPNAEVFSELAARLAIGDAEEEIDTLLHISGRMPAAVGGELMERGVATPPYDGQPIQFVDVFPLTRRSPGRSLPGGGRRTAPAGLYVFSPTRRPTEYPLALISPSSEKTISSTLGELRARAAFLQMHPSDAADRGLAQDDPVRIFNELGEVHCPVAREPRRPPRHHFASQGAVAQEHLQRLDVKRARTRQLTDLGDGACFNDARVQVALLGRH